MGDMITSIEQKKPLACVSPKLLHGAKTESMGCEERKPANHVVEQVIPGASTMSLASAAAGCPVFDELPEEGYKLRRWMSHGCAETYKSPGRNWIRISAHVYHVCSNYEMMLTC